MARLTDLIARHPGVDPRRIETVCTSILERSRRAWPTIRVDEGRFLDHVLANAEEDAEGPLANLERVHAEDLFLAYACALGVPEAHKIFASTVLSAVPRHVAQVNQVPAFAAEVQQDLAERLLVGSATSAPRIGAYKGEGPLGAWVRISAIRTARSLMRKKTEHEIRKPTEDVDRVRSPNLDPELALIKRRYSKVFSEAFQATLATLDIDARNVLRLHYVDGLSVEDVARSYRVSRATANRWLMKARETIVSEVGRRLRERIGASLPDTAALLSLVQSQLNVSIRRHLSIDPRPPPHPLADDES